MDGGNGTGRSLLRPGAPRDFSASAYFEAAGVAVLVLLVDAVLLLLDSEEELEEVVDAAGDDEEEEEAPDEAPSFFVEL